MFCWGKGLRGTWEQLAGPWELLREEGEQRLSCCREQDAAHGWKLQPGR